MEFQPLEYIYLPSGIPDAPTLLLLHGTGGDERDLLPLAKNFGTGINVLGVRGNVLENGMPRFFKRIGMGVFDEADLAFRSSELVAFLENAAAEKGFDVTKITALGYSNGANIAAAILNLYPDFFSGAILFRPMKPFKNEPFVKAKRKVPVFISSGTSDQMANVSETEAYIALLKSAGFEVGNHQIDAGHNLTQQDVMLAVNWFRSHSH